MAEIRGAFTVTKADGSVYFGQTMHFPNLSGDLLAAVNDYMARCVAYASNLQKKGNLTVSLTATVDGVPAPDVVATGVSKKELVRLERKMHQYQQDLLDAADDAVS